MTNERLPIILSSIRQASIGILGDFCLDAYWDLDTGTPALSIETGKPTHAVRTQRYSLGGAGNVANNVAALGAKSIQAFGVIGDDLFGREMVRILHEAKIETPGIIVQPNQWDTPVYAKPYLGADEQDRVDFGRFNAIASSTTDALISVLESSLPRLDALIINQQLPHSIYSEDVISALNRMAENFSDKIFLLDSRDRSLDFRHMIYKINALEAARIFGKDVRHNEEVTTAELETYAASLHQRFGKPVFITRSSEGLFLFDGNESHHVPAIPVEGPLDPVGAGDTVVAALASSLAAGASLKEAGVVASLAAAVTVRKIKQTGTATAEEILLLTNGRGDSF
ncbi:MAG: PfkB family carbohydrate kinase [Bacteroidota bacterium]